MLSILAALLPVFLLIALGYAARRLDFPGQSFWTQAARLTYWVFVPALLIDVLARVRLEGAWLRVSLVAIAAILLTALITWWAYLLYQRLSKSTQPKLVDGPGFSSVLQGSVRHNTYIALAVAAGAFDQAGMAILIVLLAITTPVVNVIAVLGLVTYGKTDTQTQGRREAAIRALITNPFIIACAIGLLLGYTKLQLPDLLAEIIRLIAQPALTLGLLVVGAGLQLRGLWPRWHLLLAGSALRLLLYPALALGMSYLMDLEAEQQLALMLFASLPTASSAYVLAVEMGGDEKLMAELITVQTLLAAITMPWVMSW